MSDQIKYKGSRWYKCDLHLHSTASKCFKDQTISANQWINKAIEQELNCIAVTDHNTGVGIDEIILAAKDKDIIVFPGVEITCDTSKIHLLVLFDVNRTSADIRDFLVRADIKAKDFGEPLASTTKNIFDIVKLATEDGALVIPAHIDSHSGLGSVSSANLKKFFSSGIINSVQIVHSEFLDKELQTTNNEELKTNLNNYYNNPTPLIDDTSIKNNYKTVQCALENNLAILKFSDNPHQPDDTKHGLWGIGRNFTWIKMDEKPTLESLRQAFLLPNFRIKTDFSHPDNPYSYPNIWIKSIEIKNTKITDKQNPLVISFNPQLNTIIGGRGSGKSSILRFIRGVFNRTADLNELEDIFKDYKEFYKKESGRPKKGVLKEDTEIIIKFVRNGILHKVIATEILNAENQNVVLKKFIDEDSSWQTITDEGYIDFFEFEQYSQKQIYEIAQEPNALRERIDKAIEGIETLNYERSKINKSFLEKSASIRTANQIISNKGKIETKIKDLDESIKKLKQSGIAELLQTKEKFINEEKTINTFASKIEEKRNVLNRLIQNFDINDINYSEFSIDHKQALEPVSKFVIDSMLSVKENLQNQSDELLKIRTDYNKSIDSSIWKTNNNENISNFEAKRNELEQDGIKDIENFENLSKEKEELENSLNAINKRIEIRNIEIEDRTNLQKEFLSISKEITLRRQEFLADILKDGKVKIKINQFRNKNDFEAKLRHILQRENDTYQQDIDELMKICFTGLVERQIEKVREIILKIRNGEEIDAKITGYFKTLITSMTDAQIDEIELLLPEDEIEVQYKPTDNLPFRSLSTASAGQKTTAILTFILSYGNIPLILDQPEDDLDNRLVYDLIVDRLRQAKENRQLIVVTHNANIPVNSDAEYIISMDSESKVVKIACEGTIEQSTLKKEICDVMEGGEIAFEMRSKRYRDFN